MTKVNQYRVEDGESIDLPSGLTESGVTVLGTNSKAWIQVIEDESATTTTYTRHIDVVTADPAPPKAQNVVVLRHNGDIIDYLEAQ